MFPESWNRPSSPLDGEHRASDPGTKGLGGSPPSCYGSDAGTQPGRSCLRGGGGLNAGSPCHMSTGLTRASPPRPPCGVPSGGASWGVQELGLTPTPREPYVCPSPEAGPEWPPCTPGVTVSSGTSTPRAPVWGVLRDCDHPRSLRSPTTGQHKSKEHTDGRGKTPELHGAGDKS